MAVRRINLLLPIKIIAIGTCLAMSLAAMGNVPIIPSPPQLSAKGYLLIDAATGEVIVEHNSLQRLPPASLTKIMTSFVAAKEVK